MKSKRQDNILYAVLALLPELDENAKIIVMDALNKKK